MLELGTTLVHKKTKVKWRVAAVDGPSYVLTPADDFGENWKASTDDLKEHFGKIERPPAPTGEAEERSGWLALAARASVLAGLKPRRLRAQTPEQQFASGDKSAVGIARAIFANPEQRGAAAVGLLPMSEAVAKQFDRLEAAAAGGDD
jgi:hypothetical protein